MNKKEEPYSLSELCQKAIKGLSTRQADRLLKEIVDWCEQNKKMDKLTRKQLYKRLRSNVGYFSGYYSSKEMNKIQKTFKCRHPVFG